MAVVHPIDLVEGGYLLDLNRRWAHPIGLVFGVSDGQIVVLDRRDKPGGVVYGDDIPADAARKILRVQAQRKGRAVARSSRYGGVLEPVDGVNPRSEAILVRTFHQPEEAHEALSAIAAGEAGAILAALAAAAEAQGGVLPGELEEWLSDALPGAILRAVSAMGLCMLVDLDGRAYLDPRLAKKLATEREKQNSARKPFDRIRSIKSSIMDDLQIRYAQLYPDEVEQLLVACRRAEGLEMKFTHGEDVANELSETLGVVDKLFGLAQQGMRYWRGDNEARDRFEKVKHIYRKAMDDYVANRSDYIKILAGEIAASDVKDIDAVKARLQEELDSTVKSRQDLLQDIERLELDRKRYQSALDALGKVDAP